MDQRHKAHLSLLALGASILTGISLFFAATTNSLTYLATAFYLGWIALSSLVEFFSLYGKKHISGLLPGIPFLGGSIIALGAGTIINDTIFFADQHKIISIDGAGLFFIVLIIAAGIALKNCLLTPANIHWLFAGFILFLSGLFIHFWLPAPIVIIIDLLTGAIFSLVLVYKGIELMWRTYQKIDEQLYRGALREWPPEQPIS